MWNLKLFFPTFSDSLYPFCAIENSYVLGEPDVIIGEETNAFEWRGSELYFPDKDGTMVPVEGLLLCRVCLPRDVAKNLHGYPFLPQKVREKSIAAECGLSLRVKFKKKYAQIGPESCLQLSFSFSEQQQTFSLRTFGF